MFETRTASFRDIGVHIDLLSHIPTYDADLEIIYNLFTKRFL